jgi:hypothetical protein
MTAAPLTGPDPSAGDGCHFVQHHSHTIYSPAFGDLRHTVSRMPTCLVHIVRPLSDSAFANVSWGAKETM